MPLTTPADQWALILGLTWLSSPTQKRSGHSSIARAGDFVWVRGFGDFSVRMRGIPSLLQFQWGREGGFSRKLWLGGKCLLRSGNRMAILLGLWGSLGLVRESQFREGGTALRVHGPECKRKEKENDQATRTDSRKTFWKNDLSLADPWMVLWW